MNPMIEVVFSNEHDFPEDLAALERVVSKTFLIQDITIARVGVHLIDEDLMTQLNEQYKHHRGLRRLDFVCRPEQPTPVCGDDGRPNSIGDVFFCLSHY